MSEIHGSKEDLLYIRSPQAIRDRAEEILQLCEAGETQFEIELPRLDIAADFVCADIKKNYPDLKIPLHSRMRHFEVLGKEWQSSFKEIVDQGGVNSLFELTVLSVLLDAGSGSEWKYVDEPTGCEYTRSEGLAVASLRWFERGFFSSDQKSPFRVTTACLRLVSVNDFIKAFQISEANPMEGVGGRVTLLNRLGEVLESHDQSRVSDILGSLPEEDISAVDILKLVQDELGDIWPGRLTMNGINLGDVWRYQRLGTGVKALVPFHKLSQWLSYSIVDVLETCDCAVSGVDELTGLPEYRNGGLFLDLEVIQLKDLAQFKEAHLPSSELVIEWRALTVALLDRVAEMVRQKLSLPNLPLCAVLQGGTWSAGRLLAAEMRGGLPPIQIVSDGTVF